MQVGCQKRLSWVSGHHNQINHPRNSFIPKSELDCSKRDFIRLHQGSWWAVKDTSEGNFWAGGLRPRLGNPRVWGGCHWCCLPQKQTHRLENCSFSDQLIWHIWSIKYLRWTVIFHQKLQPIKNFLTCYFQFITQRIGRHAKQTTHQSSLLKKMKITNYGSRMFRQRQQDCGRPAHIWSGRGGDELWEDDADLPEEDAEPEWEHDTAAVGGGFPVNKYQLTSLNPRRKRFSKCW